MRWLLENNIENFLGVLERHVNKKNFCLVGGVVIRHHLGDGGRGDFNDLDATIEKVSDVSPKVKKDFLIEHFHKVPGEIDNFYFLLGNPSLRKKIDLFDNSSYPLEWTTINIGGVEWRARALENQFAVCVFEARSILNNVPVEEKRIADIEKMMAIVDPLKAEKTWRGIRWKKEGRVMDVCERIIETSHKRPDLLTIKKKKSPYYCNACDRSKSGDYPVDDMGYVYQRMGYLV